jgi:hypothetical protein
MTEAERSRAQAARCTQLAHQTTDHAIANALTGSAAKNFEQASGQRARVLQMPPEARNTSRGRETEACGSTAATFSDVMQPLP